MVRERIRLHRDAGVTTLRLSPIGDTVAERLDQLGQRVELLGGDSGVVAPSGIQFDSGESSTPR